MSSCILLHVIFALGGALISWLLTSQYWQRIYNRREAVIVDRNRENRILNDEITKLNKERDAYELEVGKEMQALKSRAEEQDHRMADLISEMSRGTTTSDLEKDTYIDEMTLDEIEGRDNPDDIYPLLQSETIQDYISALRELEEQNVALSSSNKKAKNKYKTLRGKYNSLLDEHTELTAAYEKLDKKKSEKVVQQIAVKESIDMDKLVKLLQKNVSTLTKKEVQNITTPEEKASKKKK